MHFRITADRIEHETLVCKHGFLCISKNVVHIGSNLLYLAHDKEQSEKVPDLTLWTKERELYL